MALTLAQVDAFTDRAFAGNPAGICILDGSVADSWMQNLAAEMNLAETAFLRKTAEGFNLRWMTPVAEVKLCGHATLASAHFACRSFSRHPLLYQKWNLDCAYGR